MVIELRLLLSVQAVCFSQEQKEGKLKQREQSA